MGIESDHLVKVAGGGMIARDVLGKKDAVPLMEVHSLGGLR
jgi:hypothetical protein